MIIMYKQQNNYATADADIFMNSLSIKHINDFNIRLVRLTNYFFE